MGSRRVATILVVEDDPIIRNLVVRILSQKGQLVFEADNANEALIICRGLRNESLDLVITEHRLRDVTGREVATQILEHCPNIKVLHLSTWPYNVMEREGGLLPGSSFLQKPFTAGQLVEAVELTLNPRTQ